MSNHGTNLWAVTYSYSVGNSWNKIRQEYGVIIVDYSDTAGSGPLGNGLLTTADAIADELKLSNVECLSFVFLAAGYKPDIVVGDNVIIFDDMKMIKVDTTS